MRNRSPAIFSIRALASLALLTVHVGMFSALLGTRDFDPPHPPSNDVGAFFVSGLPCVIGVLFTLPAMYFYRPIARSIIAGDAPPPQRNVIVRRLFRLLPAYYVVYLVVLLTLNRDVLDDGWRMLWPVLLLHIYVPSPFDANPLHGLEVTWTVPSLVQWYLALTAIAWLTHKWARRGPTPAIRARRLMLPVPILMAIGVAWMFISEANHWDHRIIFWWPLGFAPTIGVGMFMAIQLALRQISPQDTPRLVRLAATRPGIFWLATLALYIVNCLRPFSVIGMDDVYSVPGLFLAYVIGSLFGLTAAYPLVVPDPKRSVLTDRVLGNPVLAYIGKISYGIYLWHMVVMQFYLQRDGILTGDIKELFDHWGKVGFWELEAVVLVGAIVFAALSHHLIEQPINRWSDRRFAARGAKPTAAIPGRSAPALPPVPLEQVTAMPAEKASAAVAKATADRDAVRANLIDLERSFGGRLLAGAPLAGRTKDRWDAAAADMAAVWEVFNAYSATVDEAARALAGNGRRAPADLARVTALLTTPSIVVITTPTPLARRHITDNGHRRLTPAEAVDRMNGLFHRNAGLVTEVENVLAEATSRLDGIRADLAQAKRRDPDGDETLARAITEADAELNRLLATLKTDPLSLWAGGRVDTTDLDRLHETVATILSRVADPASA